MPPTSAPTTIDEMPDDPGFIREQAIATLRAAADTTRYSILRVLQDGPLNANQVFKRIDTTLSGLTNPLAVLVRAGLIQPVAKDPAKAYALTDLGRDVLALAGKAA